MKCPFCSNPETRVVDTRITSNGEAIRRRRHCDICNMRFSTYERYEDRTVMVVKKDDTREKFDKEKILNGVMKSCEKRTVSLDEMQNLADDIELIINHLSKKEVTSTYIGELVMKKLKELDQVSYVRFASVYREFKDIDSFYEELKKLKTDKN